MGIPTLHGELTVPSSQEIRVANEVGSAKASLHRKGPGVKDAAGPSSSAGDPVLGLRGRGRHIWADEDADAYVRRQREGWR